MRVRCVYLFLACSDAAEQTKDRLVATFTTPPPLVAGALEKALRRELGLLFRYWASRQVWGHLESDEADATRFNLMLLRLFVDGFKLSRDGSGLRYAELSTPAEELRELCHRITEAIGMEHPPLVAQLHGSLGSLRDTVAQHAAEALGWPLERLTPRVKAWLERPPERG